MPAADLLAVSGALALAMLACLHALVFRAQRQRWALLFTLCMSVGAVFYALDPWLRPAGDRANVAGSLLGALLMFTLLLAMMDYVGLPRRAARALAAVTIGGGAELRRLNESLEQRVAERTAELRDMVGGLESFNRSVSHDLRGPLGGMAHALRLAEAALGDGDTATVARVLPVVADQAERSAELVRALLTLAHAGAAELQPRAVALTDVALEAVAQLQASAGPDAAPLPVDLGPLPQVRGDPGLLRQVLVNLIGNGLKFSAGAERPRVQVGAELRAGRPVIHVRDNGVGFAPDQAERLAQPFQRLHGARFAGSGVGLSIVKRIVERHGGRLWAESRPGQGATFYFTLGALT